MNYKKISFFAIIGIVVVLLGGAVIFTINYSKYNLASSLKNYALASLLDQPIQTQTSGNFAVLAGAGITVAGAVSSTTITGDIGTFPTTDITGLTNIVLTGENHAGDDVTQTAKGELSTAYDAAALRTPTTTYGAIYNLGGLTLTPGVYKDPSSFAITGTLTLDAENNPNAVWIFQAVSTLDTAAGAPGTPGSKIALIHGAQACNVFWQVGSSATIGTYSEFVGNIFASESITVKTGATVNGRLLAKNGAVTLDTNTITLATCSTAATLTLVKTIVGGTRTFTDFPLTATGPTTTITGVYPASAITNATVDAGTYTLSETEKYDYTAGTWSCTKNPGAVVTTGASITLASGYSAICTIQNTYSGGGGISYTSVSNVPPLIDVVKVPSPLALPNGPGPVTYTYTLRNVGTVPVNNITMVDDTCRPIIFVSGDTNSDSKLDVNETWTYDCFKTLSATQTNTVVATGWANGISATDIATATVVVGVPAVVPPLIHVIKVPSPLALPAGGGMVTYTYTVTNPGTVPLSNVSIIDDKCIGLPGRVIGHPGDINKNNLLESNESWTFTCQSTLTKTTTNVATVSGQANGITARDVAIATVIVAGPKLPNTGFAPSAK